MSSVAIPAFATVQPTDEQLTETAHLVVIAQVTDVDTPEAQGAVGWGQVSIRIETVLKGESDTKTLSFSHYFSDAGKGNYSRAEWLAFWGKIRDTHAKVKFFLFNTDMDQRYADTGIKGWILADGWFGYEVLKSR
ncbi:MAG: hypothetical protein Q8Q08_11495 [Candidatus Omnitrophota bacterium]|nr:hypothetical protein [Candidatus Omnitrophota bacterium]